MLGDEISEYEVCRTCSMHRKDEKRFHIFAVKFYGRHHTVDLGVDEYYQI